MTTSYLASQLFDANGTNTDWVFSFEGVAPGDTSLPYLEASDVKAQEIIPATETEGEVIIQRDVVLVNANTARVSPAVAAGRKVRIYRETENRYPLVNYQQLQAVGEEELDLANRQAIFITQEAFDRARGSGNLPAETLAEAAGLAAQAAASSAAAEAAAAAAASSALDAVTAANSALRPVDSVATLRTTVAASALASVYLRGYYSTHPGQGAGVMLWDAASTAPDNGGTVFAVAGVPTGRWVRAGGPIFSIEDFGAASHLSSAQNTAAINDAITVAAGAPVRIPARRYKYSGTLSLPSICVIGERMPVIGSGRNNLENGSILEGTVDWDCTDGMFVDFGVDRGFTAFPASPGNALAISSQAYNTGRQIVMHRCVGLGASPDDLFHAILVQGFSKAFISQCIGVRTYYGIAAKVNRAVITDFLAEDNGLYGGIVKSDLSQGTTADVLVRNFIVEGNAGATNIALNIESDDAQIARYQVSGLDSRNCVSALRVRGDVIATDGVIGNIVASGCTGDAIITTGSVYNLTIHDVSLSACSARALNVADVRHLRIKNFFASSVAGGGANFSTDFILIGASTQRTDLSGIALSDNYSQTAGAGGMIKYDNPRGTNILGEGYYKMTGVGAPVTQLNTFTVEPTTAQTIPTYKVAKLRAGWTGTAARDWRLDASNVPDGHRVDVENATGQNLLVRNTDAVVIVTLATGRVATFVAVNGYYNLLRNEAL